MNVSVCGWEYTNVANYIFPCNAMVCSIIAINVSSLLNCVPRVLKKCSRANVPCLLTCSRANMSCVLTCSRPNVPYVLTCSRPNVLCMLTGNLRCVLTYLVSTADTRYHSIKYHSVKYQSIIADTSNALGIPKV